MAKAKACTRCHEVKPLDEFHRHKLGRGGRRPRCKACTKAEGVEYSARPEIKARRAAHYEANREALSRRQAERYTANKEAILAQRREYVARPEVKALRAEHNLANPHVGWESKYRERAKQFGFGYLIPSMQSFTREELVWLHGDNCYHCGGEWDQLDHWPVPVSQGGHHALYNCVPSCADCNQLSWRAATQSTDTTSNTTPTITEDRN